MRFQALMKFTGAFALALAVMTFPMRSLAQGGDTVLKPAETQKLLPASVYYKAQSAPTQLRNSTGIKFSDGYYLLSTMVDTSGYSSDVQAKYQAYFITELALKIGGHDLPAGIYGVGFIPGQQFIVLDVGAHDLFTVASHSDADMKRPTPLKVTAEAQKFRLYEGRNYIEFSR